MSCSVSERHEARRVVRCLLTAPGSMGAVRASLIERLAGLTLPERAFIDGLEVQPIKDDPRLQVQVAIRHLTSSEENALPVDELTRALADVGRVEDLRSTLTLRVITQTVMTG